MDEATPHRFRLSRRQLLAGAAGAGAAVIVGRDPRLWRVPLLDDVAPAAFVANRAPVAPYPVPLQSAVYGGELQYFRM
ncbi:MAG: twin-arginine translocation signal domain-containing protein, partial [Acidimicrobiales bacterium]